MCLLCIPTQLCSAGRGFLHLPSVFADRIVHEQIQKLFPDIAITLEQIHVLENSVTAELSLKVQLPPPQTGLYSANQKWPLLHHLQKLSLPKSSICPVKSYHFLKLAWVFRHLDFHCQLFSLTSKIYEGRELSPCLAPRSQHTTCVWHRLSINHKYFRNE